MFRLLSAAVALALVASIAVTADDKKDDKKWDDPITEIPVEKADKIETKDGSVTKPHLVWAAADLEPLVKDEATRKRLVKLVDFKTHKLMVFAWEGSGKDTLEYTVLESYPEQIAFTYTPGETDDLRRHVRVFVLRKNVMKWSMK